METPSLEQKPSQNEIESARNTAMDMFRIFQEENRRFIEDIKQILESNPDLKTGIANYGPVKEVFEGFSVKKWSQGAIEGDTLDQIDGSIQNAPSSYPDINILNETISTWHTRKEMILDDLRSFTGTASEATDLAQKLHKEYVLKDLNSIPLFKKI